MIKPITIFTLNLFLVLCCQGQQIEAQAKKNNAVLITKRAVSKSERGNEVEISKILYTFSSSGDQCFAYKLSGGHVSEATDYSLVETKSGLFFIAKRLFSNQNDTDSLHIAFDDNKHLVSVGKADQYSLFPSTYISFKKQVNENRNILVLLKLLEDNIGDYPIENLLPLLMGKPGASSNQIKQAKITTQRNQSDSIRDTWTCSYDYDNAGRLISVKAAADNEVRFQKTVAYNSRNISIKTYRNIEDRQITNRKVSFDVKGFNQLKWTDEVVETGLNVETEIETTMIIKNISGIKKADMSKQEVLNLIRHIK
jgi:YD repeat-containing protein